MTTTSDPGGLRAFAGEVVHRLRSAGHEALFAGGCVRDLLLGCNPKDYDVATSARPEQVQGLFRRTTAVGAAFGVVLVRGPRQMAVEVATFRADGKYHDGRRPENVRFTDAREDAQRRDFTINGMFFDPVGDRVLDFVGGQEDLRRRTIRAIGEPDRRFDEDKLRLIRAVRFAARLDFSIEPETLDAVRRMASQLLVVSGERILLELKTLLESPSRGRGVQLIGAAGLAPVVFAEARLPPDGVEAVERVAARVARLPEGAPLAVCIAAAFHELLGIDAASAAEAFFDRLRGSNADRDFCDWLLGRVDDVKRAPEESLAFRKRLYADPRWPWLRALAESGGDSLATAWCERDLASLPSHEIDPPPLLTGDDLKRHGFTPGPVFKEWLRRLRDLQLNGEISSQAEAISQVRSWSVTP